MESNNLPTIKNKNGIFKKIGLLFKSLFNKKSKIVENGEEAIKEIPDENKQVTFIESLKEKTDIKNAEDKEEVKYIVQKIEENPDILDNLSLEKLEKVNNYYIDKIQEIDKKINKIKNIN